MLGEGIVCLGVVLVTVSCRNEKSSPKIVSDTPMRPSMRSAAGWKSIVPSGLRNSTWRSLGALLMPSSA